MQARYEPVDLAAVTAELASVFRSAVERAGLRFEVDCPPLDRTGVRRPRHVGEGRPQPASQRAEVHLRRLDHRRGSPRRGRPRRWSPSPTPASASPAAEMPRLFERFHRIENARSRSNEGSGIGLALVKELVGLHGGTITADSTDGAGTTLHHPAAVRRGPPAGRRAVDAGPGAPVPPDRRAVRAGGAALAARGRRRRSRRTPSVARGHAAPTAGAAGAGAGRRRQRRHARLPGPPAARRRATGSSAVDDGQEALDALRADPPDLVVSDVMMPRLDGLALVAALRGDPRTAGAAGAAAVRPRRAGGLHRGAGGRRRRLPGQAVRRRRAAGPGAGQRRAGPAAQPPRPLAHRAGRLAAGGVLRLRRGRRASSRSTPRSPTSSATAPRVCPTRRPPVVAGRRRPTPRRTGRSPDAFAGLLDQTDGAYTMPVTHRDGHRLWVAASFNHVDDPDTGRRSSSAPSATSPPSTTRVQRQTALWPRSAALAQAETRRRRAARRRRTSCAGCGRRAVCWPPLFADTAPRRRRRDPGARCAPAMPCDVDRPAAETPSAHRASLRDGAC